MADVVVGVKALGHADLELGVAGHAECLPRAGCDPCVGAGQLVVAATGHAFHDLGCAGVKRQRGGQDHAHGFLGAIGKGDAVADAFAIEIDIG